MKTILKIIIILLLSAVISGGFYLAFNHNILTGSISGFTGGRGEGAIRPAGQPSLLDFQPGRPDGENDHRQGVSLVRGIAQASGVVVKISIILLLILLGQKVVRLVTKKQTRVAI